MPTGSKRGFKGGAKKLGEESLARQEPAKDTRLNIRISAQQRALLRRVAEAQGRSVSDFVVATAMERVEEFLVERRHFVASPEAWDQFMQALEAPPKPVPALVDLFRDTDL
jgi:uncharacterized protein (DUF1778 family)